jgi:DMSO/TMAO reductase YedYZ molybdopterin-dependent catalytic subunit
MSRLSRRQLITTGLVATAGVSGAAVAAKLASRYGLIPPNAKGLYGLGDTLTYASHRLLTSRSMAREFPRSAISTPFANGRPPEDDEFKRLQLNRFADWRLAVDGMITRPVAFSLAELKSLPPRSQITHLACEEGWSFIAEWSGVPLSEVLHAAGMLQQAKYVVYFSMDRNWWDSIDIDEALHPQTLVTYGMNGQDLPIGHGGPLRLRVPRQLGYKSVKYISRITVTDDLKKFGKGLGSSGPEYGYSWYAGI